MQKGLERLSAAACCVLGTVITCVLMVQNWTKVNLVPKVRAQANTRTVIVDPPHRNDPIEVVRVLGHGKAALIGEPSADDLQWWWDGGRLPKHQSRVAYRLPSDDNWLKTLSFVLRNRTSEKITALDIVVVLPLDGMKTGSEFSFGQLPASVAFFTNGQPIVPTKEPISFKPGEEMTFALADDQIGLNRLDAEPVSVTSQVRVLFRVYLEDGLSWMQYMWEKHDPEHPGHWVTTTGPYFPPNGLPGPVMNPHKSDN